MGVLVARSEESVVMSPNKSFQGTPKTLRFSPPLNSNVNATGLRTAIANAISELNFRIGPMTVLDP